MNPCDECHGACCREMNSPPFDGPADPIFAALPADVRADYDRGMALRKARDFPGPVPCFWLSPEGKCRHYDHRPRICREVPAGGDVCRNWCTRLADAACPRCGERHPIIHVTRLAADPPFAEIHVGLWQLTARSPQDLAVQAGRLMLELQCCRRQLAALTGKGPDHV